MTARNGRVAAGVAVGAVGASGVLGATVFGGLGWYYSSVLLDPTRRRLLPEQVLAADRHRIVLAATRLAAQPGVWGLRTHDGLTEMGPVTSARRVGRRGGYVVRTRLGGAVPAAGDAAVLDAGPYDPDPSARGLAFDDVAVPGPLGPCPAWHVPGPQHRGLAARRPGGDDTWVVAVHGRGGSRREALRILPTLHAAGHPVLVISYRNDPDAPASPDGHYHLGDTEWQDLAAAVTWARARGARRLVLYGWSMGAAVIAAFLDRAPDADMVVGVVWDAPLLDWRTVLRRQARNRRLPGALVPLATSITTRRIGIDFDRFDLLRRPPAVRPPALVVHSDIDSAVPVAMSRAFAAAAADLDWSVRYLEVADVEHTASWNADPARYEGAVADFLRTAVSGPTDHRTGRRTDHRGDPADRPATRSP